MGVVLIFVIHIKNYSTNKNYTNYMAEKSKDKKPEVKKHHHSGGEMSFGLEIILFILAIFVVWVLVNKPTENADKPFIKGTNTVIPQ